jgi:hypothetical protein
MSVKDLTLKMPMKEAFNWFGNSSADSRKKGFRYIGRPFWFYKNLSQLIQCIPTYGREVGGFPLGGINSHRKKRFTAM